MISNNYYYNLNNCAYRPQFKAIDSSAPLEKPIEVVQKTIEDSVAKLTPNTTDERKKKTRNTAIAVGSTVVVVSAFMALLNPRSSGRLMTRVKEWQNKAKIRLEKNGKNTFWGKIYSTGVKTSEGLLKTLNFTNTFNAGKDMALQNLLTKKAVQKPDDGVWLKIWKPIHSAIATVMKKPCELITKGFDKVSRSTVTSGYNNALKKMNKTEDIIKLYMERLSPEEKRLVTEKLNEISAVKKYFSEANTVSRLNKQEELMANLETDFAKRFGVFWSGFEKHNPKQWKNHIGDNMSFWAEDILKQKKDALIKDGSAVVDKIAGNADNKGLYTNIVDILAPKLTPEERSILEKSVSKTTKKLRKSNWDECAEYFDKKRDLVLGSALSDGLSAILGLGLSGIAVGTAHSKEDRASRALSVGFPVIAGLGSSLVLAMRLVPGVKCLVSGWVIGALLSTAGSQSGKYVAQHMRGTNNGTNPVDSKEGIPQQINVSTVNPKEVVFNA